MFTKTPKAAMEVISPLTWQTLRVSKIDLCEFAWLKHKEGGRGKEPFHLQEYSSS